LQRNRYGSTRPALAPDIDEVFIQRAVGIVLAAFLLDFALRISGGKWSIKGAKRNNFFLDNE